MVHKDPFSLEEGWLYVSYDATLILFNLISDLNRHLIWDMNPKNNQLQRAITSSQARPSV